MFDCYNTLSFLGKALGTTFTDGLIESELID
jgi:hypothetical protein